MKTHALVLTVALLILGCNPVAKIDENLKIDSILKDVTIEGIDIIPNNAVFTSFDEIHSIIEIPAISNSKITERLNEFKSNSLVLVV